MKDNYERPQISEIGAVHELTKQDKDTQPPTDGFTFLGQPIGNVS